MAIGTGLAIIGGAIIGGVVASSAAKKAAAAASESTQAAISAQESAIDVQQEQFEATQSNLQPSLEAGNLAREEQQALIGLSGPEAEAAALSRAENSPGQQFLRDRAQKNLLRNASAIGGLGGGNVRKALVRQGVGFAQQDLQNRFGRLGQLAGQGQAAGTAIGQFGQASASNIGNAASNIGSAAIAGGTAASTGILNQNTAFQTGLTGVLAGAAQSGLVSDPVPDLVPEVA